MTRRFDDTMGRARAQAAAIERAADELGRLAPERRGRMLTDLTDDLGG